MAKRLVHIMYARRRVLLAAALVVLALGVGGALELVPSAIYLARISTWPQAASATPAAPSQALLHFRFRGNTRFVRVAIDPAELAAARQLNTSCVFSSVGAVRKMNLKALVWSQARSATVGAIASELRGIRDDLSLGSDEYLELLARFVQEIPYGTVDDEVRLPVEVIAARSGVCDDKSVLMAALLLHEGYDTAIWAFDSQAHAAVGVRCTGPGTFGSGYALIETTRVAYVGDSTGDLGTRAAWRRNPALTRLGGSSPYTADGEAAFLVSALQRAETTARALSPYARALASGPMRWRPVYAEEVRRQREAQQLAMLIERSVDERHRAYEQVSAATAR